MMYVLFLSRDFLSLDKFYIAIFEIYPVTGSHGIREDLPKTKIIKIITPWLTGE